MKKLPCPIERWPTYTRLVDEALTQPQETRLQWLDALPADVDDLKPILRRMLDGLPQALGDDFMEQLPQRTQPSEKEDERSDVRAGQTIGPYTLVRELGRGGMGVVWLARRNDGAYNLEVALKLPHVHLLSATLRQRFERERDILASLSHPAIARFYDAGLTDTGQPYLALEAVQGSTITRWARQHKLDLRARLALFRQVASAVEFAHSKMVAHRDLKPANVLVTEQGQVRLLDFGIAKLLDETDDGTPRLTRDGAMLATPEYAAPEQLGGGTITVATDVYALGAMLFELLTGSPPFTNEGRRRRLTMLPPGADRRAAPLASSQVVPSHVENLGTTVVQWRNALQGDMDAILCQALQMRPEDRYTSVAEFSADLARFDGHYTVKARRTTLAEQAWKFVRRHRVGVAFSVVLVASITTGVAGMAWQTDVARREAQRAEAVKGFLLSVFRASDPRQASDTPRGQITAKALLDLSAPKIEASFASDPALQIELLHTVADIYRELGEDAPYELYQNRQLALTTQHYGPLHDNLIEGALEAANRARDRADHKGCLAHLAKADETIRAARREASALRAHWWLTRSTCLRDQASTAAEREAALKTALQTFERYAPNDPGRVTTLAEMSTEAQHANRYEESIALNRQAIAMALTLPKRNDAELQTLYSNLAGALQQSGDLRGAETAFAASADMARKTTGEGAKIAWLPAGNRARTAHLAGDRLRAVALFDELIKILPGPEDVDPENQSVREFFGDRLAAEGRPELAIPLLEPAERAYLSNASVDFALRRVRVRLGDAYDRAGNTEQARKTLRAALDDYIAKGDPASQPVAAIHERWGRFLLDHGETDVARVQFDAVVTTAKTKTWSHVALAQAGLARVALANKDPAASLRLSDQALETWGRRTGFFDIRMEPYLWRVKAAALAAGGDANASLALRMKALEASKKYDAPQSPTARELNYVGM